MKDRLHTFFYWLHVRTWGGLIIWLTTNRVAKGRRNIRRGGPLILASNHLNLADPPILITIVPRRIIWMAKQELFDYPVLGLLYHSAGFIPVRRGKADLRAFRQSERTLRKGCLLGMFPEGKRSTNHGLQRAEPGTALLALRTGAPVLPVAIWGTEVIKLPASFLKRTRVNIVFGEPFQLTKSARPTREQVAEGADEIMRRIAALLPVDYRGVYGEGSAEAVSAADGKAR